MGALRKGLEVKGEHGHYLSMGEGSPREGQEGQEGQVLSRVPKVSEVVVQEKILTLSPRVTKIDPLDPPDPLGP